MRTTIDLPNELLRRARVAAVERGTTLRKLIWHALAHELGVTDPLRDKSKRVHFPIFNSVAPGTTDLTSSDLAAVEVEEDSRRHGVAR